MSENRQTSGEPLATPKQPPKPAANENQITETSATDNATKTPRRYPMKFEEIEPPLPPIWKLGPQVLASLSVSLCSMVVGFASAYTSPALASMKAANGTIVPTLQQESWIGSLMPLCGLFGGIVGGPLIELLGRKTTILATSVPFIGSFFLIAMAVNIPMIYMGRSIGGFCVGITSLCLPVYLGETLQPEVRGMLGLLPTTVGNVGMLLAFVAGKFLDWSQLAYLGASLPLFYMSLMFVIPETPRWYISKDKPEKARRALQWLRGKDACVTSELNSTRYAHREEQKQSKNSKIEMFNKANLKLIATSLGLMFFQQMSGINAVVFYSVSIFEDAGGSIDSFLSTIIMGIVNFGATFAASLLIDRLGRKVLLYISASAMILALSMLGGFFYFKNSSYPVDDYGWLPLVCIVTYVIGFSFGYGPIPWLMMGEILPAKIRGASASIVTGFNWSCTFVVTKTFKDLTVLVGEHGTFWIFASLSLMGIIFVALVVPETRGRSLEDIERKYKGPMTRRMSSLANLKPLPMNL